MSLDNSTQEAVKYDQDKLPEHLYSIPAHNDLLKVLAFGAKKYGQHNWRKGMDWSRVYAAAERHLHAWFDGQDKDPETGLSHLAHAMCCTMFLLHYIQTETGKDDRPTKAAI